MRKLLVACMALVIGLMALPTISTPAKAEVWEWHFKSNHAYKVYIRFYSESRKVYWPSGEVWVLDDYETKTMRINCVQGEKVCYGAWNKNRSLYWGGGENNSKHC